jgi:FkbM family methyltransferase
MGWLRRLRPFVPRSPFMFNLCQRYQYFYNNSFCNDFLLNGEFRFLANYLKAGFRVFDIGANVGMWAQLALRSCPDIELHCFEPCRETFEMLKTRLVNSNVTINNFGMGSVQGKRTLYKNGPISGNNTCYRRNSVKAFEQFEIEEIELDTVDNYCKINEINRVDFVKIDVEGHEFSVLEGMSEIISRGNVGAIQFEYGSTYIDARVFLKDIFELIQSLNVDYLFYRLLPESIQHHKAYDQRLETFELQNWAIIHRNTI